MDNETTKSFDKKKAALVTGIAVLIMAIIAGAIFLLVTVNSPAYINKNARTQAESYKKDALSALQSDKTSETKALFLKAKEQYQKIGDTAGTTDMDAQIYLIEHSGN